MLVDGGTGVTPTSSGSSPITVLPKRNSAALSEKPSQSPVASLQKSSVKASPVERVRGSPIDRGRCLLSSVENRRHQFDTPPLIDVEARLANTPPHVLIRSISSLSQQSIRPKTPDTEEENIGTIPAMRKGILLQARDRLFSRWKERYFVLTKDYLACFRRGSTKYSEMGSFIFKINLASVDTVGWEDRRGGPVLSICLPREGKMLLRAKSGLDQWYRDLREATAASRNRRNALRRGSSTTHLNHLLSSNVHASPPFKPGGNLQFSLSDSTPEIVQLCESVCRATSPGAARNISRPNRFSLLTNMDVGSCDGDLTTPPSSVNSSHKFSSSTSSTSGSGGSSSLASSPSLRGSSAWPRPLSPVRAHGGDAGPRSRFSLYEAPREPISGAAKTRYSVCVEPRGFQSDIANVFRRRQTPVNDAYRGSRSLLCLQPRNPLLDLLESADDASSPKKESSSALSSPQHKLSSPAKSEPDTVARLSPPVPVPSRDGVDTSPSPSFQLRSRPRAHSTSITPEKGVLAPRSRTNLALFRHSAIFN